MLFNYPITNAKTVTKCYYLLRVIIMGIKTPQDQQVRNRALVPVDLLLLIQQTKMEARIRTKKKAEKKVKKAKKKAKRKAKKKKKRRRKRKIQSKTYLKSKQ